MNKVNPDYYKDSAARVAFLRTYREELVKRRDIECGDKRYKETDDCIGTRLLIAKIDTEIEIIITDAMIKSGPRKF